MRLHNLKTEDGLYFIYIYVYTHIYIVRDPVKLFEKGDFII